MASPTLVPVKAGGDINPARFCTISTTENHTVVESNSGDVKVVGVSSEATKNAPQEGGSTLAAEDGDQFEMYPIGSDPLLKLGSGGCSAGDWLTPDNSGQGVTAGSATIAHAIAWEAGSEGELVKVTVISPYLVP